MKSKILLMKKVQVKIDSFFLMVQTIIQVMTMKMNYQEHRKH